MNILVLDWLSEETNYASHTWMDYQGGETPGDSLSISYFYLLSLIFVYTFPCAISLLANKSLALIFNFKHCKPATSNAFLSLIFFFYFCNHLPRCFREDLILQSDSLTQLAMVEMILHWKSIASCGYRAERELR